MMRSSMLGRAVWTLTVIFLLAGAAVPHASAAEVSSLQSILTTAPANTVYFVFPDWDSSHRKALGVGYAQVTDWTALGYVYGMFTNAPQITMLDTDTTIVDSTTGAPKLTGKVIILFGGPLVNVLVRYYEDQGVSPLYWALVGGWSGTEHYYDRAGNSVASMTVGQIGGGSSDIALVEIFTDSAANTIVVFSGFGWHGTFTAGLYFKTIMGTPTTNLAGYNKSWYLFHWTDGNGNGFPEYTEVTEEVSG
jgi:hypothetical protein